MKHGDFTDLTITEKRKNWDLPSRTQPNTAKLLIASSRITDVTSEEWIWCLKMVDSPHVRQF